MKRLRWGVAIIRKNFKYPLSIGLIFGLLVSLVLCSCGLKFYEDTDKYFKIYSINTDGTQYKRLTPEKSDFANPVFSPDGEEIVCDTTYWYKTSEQKEAIYIMNKDGTGLQKIADDPSYYYEEQPHFSPDGKKISYIRDNSQLVYLDRTNNQVLELISTFNLKQTSWSPDSTEILFITKEDKILKININSKIVNELATGNIASWQPNGDKIVFANNDGLFIMSASEDSKQKISTKNEVCAISWLPNGDKIVFTDKNNGMFIIIHSTLMETKLGNNYSDVSWSPNGDYIAFIEDGYIYLIKPDGTDKKQLSRGRSPQWAPDSTQIVFYSEE